MAADSPRLAIVLSGGGVRGMAHIGALQRLHELGMRPSLVVGTSAGALVGAAYAAGKIHRMAELAHAMDWKRLTKLFLEVRFLRAGLTEGRQIQRFLNEIYGTDSFDNLKIPFATVATNLENESEVVITTGSLVKAVRASIAIPGVFTPVKHDDDCLLVDGGLVNPLPISVARQMGADIVIAIDVNLRASAEPQSSVFVARKRLNKRLNIFDVSTKSLRVMENQVARNRLQLEPPDLLIQPAVGNVLTLDFQKILEMVAAGTAAVEEQSDKVLTLIKKN